MKVRKLKRLRSNALGLGFAEINAFKKLKAKGDITLFARMQKLMRENKFVSMPLIWNSCSVPGVTHTDEILTTINYMMDEFKMKNEFICHVEHLKKRKPEDVSERYYFCKEPVGDVVKRLTTAKDY